MSKNKTTSYQKRLKKRAELLKPFLSKEQIKIILKIPLSQGLLYTNEALKLHKKLKKIADKYHYNVEKLVKILSIIIEAEYSRR